MRVTKNTDAVKDCRLLGNVYPDRVDYETRAKSREVFGAPIKDKDAQRSADAHSDALSAIYGMKWKTDELGGNTLFIVTDYPAATGEAYVCPVPSP